MAKGEAPAAAAALPVATASGESAKGPSGNAGWNAKYTRRGNPELGRLTGHEPEFQELGNLGALYEGLATKTRQHVNPLADHFQTATPAPDWAELFANPALPLQVDVGCGSGRFVLLRARRLEGRPAASDAEVDVAAAAAPEEDAGGPLADIGEAVGIAVATGTAADLVAGQPRANVVGLEIRQKLVERAQAWADRLGASNCRFLFTNATVSWKSLFSTYPGPIELVTMQFPDPHFKARHRKRRHVQPQLVREIAESLAPGARVFLQGDVPEAVRWMRDMLELHGGGRFALAPECCGGGLSRAEWQTTAALEDDPTEPAPQPLAWSANEAAGWLPENPLGVPTEREVYVAKAEAPVYRVMIVRA